MPYRDLIQVEAKTEPNAFRLDPNIPFIDQTTAITLRADGTSQQCVLAQRHQLKLTPKQLLPERLGPNARIIPALNVPAYNSVVIKLHSLQGLTVVGHFYGGMRTTDENPTSTGQSFASNRIFKVLVTPIPAACIAVPAVIQ